MTGMNGVINQGKFGSLLGDYSVRLGDAVLRNRAHAAEQAARLEADLANRIKSEFISNMSHELRTPLNTIIGFSKLISEHRNRKIGDTDIAEYARLIKDASVHLLTVINDILDISKIQSGRYTLNTREIHIDEVLTTCLNGFVAMAGDAGVVLEHRYDADLPPIRGDAAKLGQVFSNLLNNAIKFTRSGGQVYVEAIATQDEGVVVFIRDTGIGMSEEELAIALTPFGQVDASHSRWREGTGLGLPIAKALVSLHGGSLEIRSAKAMGTEVAVRLPSRHLVELVGAQAHMLGQGMQQ